jgi:hypothetical protein
MLVVEFLAWDDNYPPAQTLKGIIMTLATDQNIDRDKLSPTARRMLELRDEVLSEWMKRVRQPVKQAETSLTRS